MAEHKITFNGKKEPITVTVPTGTLLSEAAGLAGVDIMQPCGGQGRCGRCAVQITDGDVRRRSTLRLSSEDVADGYALACQSVVEGDVTVTVPEQEKIERRLTTDKTVAEVTVPDGYNAAVHQTIKRYSLQLEAPTMDEQTDDWSRIQAGLRKQAGIENSTVSLPLLQKIGSVLREGEWQVDVILNMDSDVSPRMVDVRPGNASPGDPIWGTAIDIGTTTVSLWLVDLRTGAVKTQVAEYNGQIARGEDVISRIIFSGKGNGREAIRHLVLNTINELVETACKRAQIEADEIVKTTISGNSTMIHLLLGIPAESIRLSPFITAANQIPLLAAHDVGVNICRDAVVDCLPGVASYVGSDISAGVLSSGMDDTDQITLFLDVGTNGETVMGSSEWLVTCACSAGPAFEGAGVQHGMRATKGAIEEVWVNGDNFEPSYRIIGNVKPRGVCGSGLISLMAEMFLTGLIDKSGSINANCDSERVREGEHGTEYIITWADESETGQDIVITNVDVDNLLRAKAAIYAGFTVLAESVGVPLEMVEQILIGGSFGKYINIEKAVEIGLLPDMPWDKFHFLGNTSVKGSYLALLDSNMRERIRDIASRMTYIELSADNTFYDAFMSALFLPHTDMSLFPTVEAAILNKK